jgi:hypothetical protein
VEDEQVRAFIINGRQLVVELRRVSPVGAAEGSSGVQERAPATRLPRLYPLPHSERLLAKLEELNALGCERIGHQQFYEAMVYLTEAENVL